MFIKDFPMLTSAFVKTHVKISLPILLANISVLCVIISCVTLVSYANKNNWYLMGLLLPWNYFMLGILEAGRVCSIQAINSIKETISLSRVIMLALLSMLIIGVVSLISGVMLTLFYNAHSAIPLHFLLLFGISYLASFSIVSTNSLLNAALFGIGKNKTATAIIILVSCLTFLTTLVTYFYFSWGLYSLVAGNVLAYLIGTVLSYQQLNKYYPVNRAYLTRIDLHYCWKLIKQSGIPVFLGYLLLPCALLFINKILSYWGSAAVAGFGIAYRIQSFTLLPAIAFGVTAGILINRFKTSEQQHQYTAIFFSALVYLPIAGALFITRNWIAWHFTNDVAIGHVIISYFTYYSFSYITFCPLLTLLICWEQTGRAFNSLMINLAILLLQLTLASFFAWLTQDLHYFYFVSSAVCIVVSTFVLALYFFKLSILPVHCKGVTI
jgi:Na+-driven multidrug efflux pump